MLHQAFFEVPQLVRGCFRLVHDAKANDGISDDNIFRFDGNGAMMGIHTSSVAVIASGCQSKLKFGQQGSLDWATSIACVSAVA